MARRRAVLAEDIAVGQVPIADIGRGALNVRRSVPQEQLEELKASINALGLLQPIVVMRSRAGSTFEVLIGERRLQACRELGFKTIPAVVLEEQDERTAIALSLAENIQRDELTYRETAEAVTKLYQLYDEDERKVHKATGIPLMTVRRYILASEFASANMLRMVDDRLVSLLDVKRALQAAQWNIRKAESLLEHMADMSGAQKRRLTRYAREHPGARVETMVSEASRPWAQARLLLDLTEEVQEGLNRAMEEIQMEPEEIAARALEDWLRDKGFI